MFIIDVLYIKDCEGKDLALSNLNTALSILNFNENEYFINIREIKKDKEAKLWKLAGSPTVKVNGVDVEIGPKVYGRYKREYAYGENAPCIETLIKALRMDLRERVKILEDKEESINRNQAVLV